MIDEKKIERLWKLFKWEEGIAEKEKRDRLLKWILGEDAPPYRINLHITDVLCNLNCIHCVVPKWIHNNKKLLEKEKIRESNLDIVKEAAEIGVKEWMISGAGEPFVRKKITLKAMQKIKEYGMYGIIVTNGTLLERDDIEQIINMEWDGIIFSIDGPDAKTNDFLRGKGTFEKVINIIKEFSKFKNRLNRKLPETVIASVLTNKNYNKLEDMIRLVYECSAQKFMLQPLTVTSPAIKKLQLNDLEEEIFRSTIDETVRLAKKLKITTNIDQFKQYAKIGEKKEVIDYMQSKLNNTPRNSVINLPYCFIAFIEMPVSLWGRVTVCERSPRTIGDISTTSLKKIWYGKEFTKFRHDLMIGKISHFCSRCCFGHLKYNEALKDIFERVIHING